MYEPSKLGISRKVQVISATVVATKYDDVVPYKLRPKSKFTGRVNTCVVMTTHIHAYEPCYKVFVCHYFEGIKLFSVKIP